MKAKRTTPRQKAHDRTPPAPLHTRRPCGGPHRGEGARGAVAETGPNQALEPTAPMVVFTHTAVCPWRGGSPQAFGSRGAEEYEADSSYLHPGIIKTLLY